MPEETMTAVRAGNADAAAEEEQAELETEKYLIFLSGGVYYLYLIPI